MAVAPWLLRHHAARRGAQLARQDPVAAQRLVLRRLVRRAAGTAFGRDHDFSRIRSVADYQARVPVWRFETMWRAWWQAGFPRLDHVSWPGRIPYFAVTSGTTGGRVKHIPCSRAMVRANRRAALQVLVHHLAARPASRVASGRALMLGGSTDLGTLAPGVRVGDLSAIMAAEVPFWARRHAWPPPDIALLADWRRKIDRIVDGIAGARISVVTGVPSWMLPLFERLAAGRPGGLAAALPDLELIVHGGVGFAPYRQRFDRLLRGSRAELREVYAASEGFVAIADGEAGAGMRLLPDNGLFFEFIPATLLAGAFDPGAFDPGAFDLGAFDRGALPDRALPRQWLGNAETGVDYALLVSSCAGLWSYVIGDTVRLVSQNPPRLLVTGRLGQDLSAFGEHLIVAEIDAAVASAGAAIGRDVADYTVGPVFPAGAAARYRHLFLVEFTTGVPDPEETERFAAALDARLRAGNEDYDSHRAAGVGMAMPEVRPVRPGGFAAWMAGRGKLGGQNKVPRILGDPAALQDLRHRLAPGPDSPRSAPD